MKKQITSIIALLVVATGSLFAQTTWQNVYDFAGDDYINKSVTNPDGSIVSVGSTTNPAGAGAGDAHLTKLDSNGNVLWQKQYGGSQAEIGSVVAQTQDGGYIIAGRSTSFANPVGGNPDILLIKTDASGDILWSKTYGTDSFESVNAIAVAPNGGFIVTGESRVINNNRRKMFLLNTDALGNLKFYKTYGFQFGNESGFGVTATSDGKFVAVGYTGASLIGLNDAYIVIADSVGDIEFQFVLGGAGDDVGRKVYVDETNSKVYIAGSTRVAVQNADDIFIARLDVSALPTLDWAQAYGGNANEALTGFQYIPTGALGPFDGLALSGFSNSFSANNDGIVFLVQTTGTIVGTTRFKGASDDVLMDIALGVNGPVVSGYSNSFGGTQNNGYVLQFTDPGNMCWRSDVTLAVTTLPFSIVTNMPDHFATADTSVHAEVVTLTQATPAVTITGACSIIEALSANAGNNANICGGGGIGIGGGPTGSGGQGELTYLWSPSAGLNDSTSSNPFAFPQATTTYTVVVTDTAGATASAQVTVNVNAYPTVGVNADTTICAGNAVALEATGATTYAWSPASGLSSTSGSNVTATPNGTETYTIIGTSNGCADTTTVTITVNPNPTITVSADTTICAGNTVILTAAGATTLDWSPGTSLNTTSGDTVEASPQQTTTYTVSGSNGGCVGSAQVTVSVDPCTPPSTDFVNVYDVDSGDFGNMSIYIAGGHIITVGSSNNASGQGDFDVTLAELDSAGNVIWRKQYGGSKADAGTAVVATGDGYVIAGRSNSYSSGASLNDVLLMKTDLTGAVVWSKTFGSDTLIEQANSLVLLSDGSIGVAGTSRTSANQTRNMLMLRTDANGNIKWYRTYGHPSSNDEAYHISQAGPRLLGVGYTGAGGKGFNDGYLVQADTGTGAVLGQFLFGGPGDDIAKRVIVDGKGHVYVAGNTRAVPQNASGDNVFIAKVNVQALPFVEWTKQYGGDSAEVVNDFVYISAFDGFGIAGSSRSNNFPAKGQDGMVFVVDSDGVAQGGLYVGGAGTETINDFEFGNSLLATGTLNSFSTNATDDQFLFQFAGDPQNLCNKTDFAPNTVIDSTAGLTFVLTQHKALDSTTTTTTANLVTINKSGTTKNVCAIAQALTADAGSSKTICGTGSVRLGGSPVATGGTGPYTYAWTPSASLDTATASNPNASPTTTTTYTVVVTDNTSATTSATVTVNVVTKPDVTVTGTGTICSGKSVTLTANGATTYAWSPATGLSATNVAAPVASPTATNTYTVIGTTSGCTDTTTVTVTVNATPNVSVSAGDSTLCDNQSTTLTATGGTTYAWSPATGLSATNVAAPVATPTVTTTYTVIGTTGGCSDTASLTISAVLICPGINEVSAGSVNVFPNPAKDYVQVNAYYEGASTNAQLVLTALDGRLVYQSNVYMVSGNNTFVVDTKEISSGVYILQLKAGGNAINKRVAIER